MLSSPPKPLMVSFCGDPTSVSGPGVPVTVAATAIEAAPNAATAASVTINLNLCI